MGGIGKLVVIKGEGLGLSCQVRVGEEVAIGRNLAAVIPIPDAKLSRIHCIVRNLHGFFEVLDNNSTNGTYLNGQKVDVVAKLQSGNIITIGDSDIRFEEEPG